MAVQNVVIVGGGRVGQTLAGRLSADGHDVTLVEADPAKVTDLSATLDVRVLHGNGATPDVLREAGAAKANLVVASTDSDEANLVVGLLASQIFEAPRIVVRVREPGHDETFRVIGATRPVEHVVVNPDAAAIDRIATLLDVPAALDVVSFFGGELFVAGFRIDKGSDFAGMRVSDMKLLFASTPTLCVAIHRGPQWIVPGGFEEIRAGDLAYFAISRSDLDDVQSLVGGAGVDSRRRVLVAGAGSVGLGLAQRLCAAGRDVTIVEPDAQAASAAAASCEDALVIHGRPTDQGLLEDEEIEKYGVFVAAGPDHEGNLVAGLLAKRLGVGRAFVIVDNPALVALVGDVGIDAIISPRSLTIGLTLQYVRGASVRQAAALLEDRVEIIEAVVPAGAGLTKAPLVALGLPRGILVAALERDGALVVPTGRDRVQAGDEVLLITTDDRAATSSELIRGDGA